MNNQSHINTEYMGYILATDYTEALFCYMQNRAGRGWGIIVLVWNTCTTQILVRLGY